MRDGTSEGEEGTQSVLGGSMNLLYIYASLTRYERGRGTASQGRTEASILERWQAMPSSSPEKR